MERAPSYRRVITRTRSKLLPGSRARATMVQALFFFTAGMYCTIITEALLVAKRHHYLQACFAILEHSAASLTGHLPRSTMPTEELVRAVGKLFPERY